MAGTFRQRFLWTIHERLNLRLSNSNSRLQLRSRKLPEIPAWRIGNAVPPDEAVLVSHMWDEIRRLMWDYVGIVRTNKRLARAAHRIKTLRKEIRDYYFRYLVTPDTLELRNLAVCAELIVKSAQKRRESRGLHFTLDYPRQSKRPRQTVIEGYRG